MTSPSIFGATDPFQLTRDWMEEATTSEPNDPNAMALASVDAEGLPNVRIVLLKSFDSDGFVFYTNYDSAKGREILGTEVAAFVLHWKTLGRQVRVRGRAEKGDEALSDTYYRSRPTDSRLGAWASHQSQPLANKQVLIDAVASARDRLGDDPPRPQFWGGIRIIPDQFEFWSDGAYRLHDREIWRRDGMLGNWKTQRLYP